MSSRAHSAEIRDADDVVVLLADEPDEIRRKKTRPPLLEDNRQAAKQAHQHVQSEVVAFAIRRVAENPQLTSARSWRFRRRLGFVGFDGGANQV